MTRPIALTLTVLALFASGYTPAPAEPSTPARSFSQTETLTAERLTVIEKDSEALIAARKARETVIAEEDAQPQS